MACNGIKARGDINIPKWLINKVIGENGQFWFVHRLDLLRSGEFHYSDVSAYCGDSVASFMNRDLFK